MGPISQKPNERIEEYLENLYTLTRNAARAGTTEVSKKLEITPASVTEMLKKLADKGYVKYSPYYGTSLTKKGIELAEKVARKHWLLERFLHDILRIRKDVAHQHACEMEHSLPDEAERALSQFLAHPERCLTKGNSFRRLACSCLAAKSVSEGKENR